MMMTTSAPVRIRDFVAEVARHFQDLPESEQSDLLDDLEQHLTELAADDPEALEQELVDPATYAAELRRSAGLSDLARADLQPSRRRRLRQRIEAKVDQANELPLVQEWREFLPHLRPAWWVVRGWVLAVAAAQVTVGGPWWRHVPVPGRHVVGLLVAMAAITVSVRLGRDQRDDTRPWRVVDVAARVVLALGLIQAITSGMATEYVTISEAEAPWEPPVLRHPDGEPITNLYLFDADGDPVEDVFVYDGVGRPVEIGDLEDAGFEDIDTVYPRNSDGTPLTNRYPLEQYLIEFGEPATAEATREYIPDRQPRTTPDVNLPSSTSVGSARDGGPASSSTPTSEPAQTPTPSETDTTDPTPSASPSPSGS